MARAVAHDPVDLYILLMAGTVNELAASPLVQDDTNPWVAWRGDHGTEAENPQVAEEWFRDALKLVEPGLVEARVRLGRVLALRQQYGEAIDALQAVGDTGTVPRLRFYRDRAIGEVEEGRRHLEAARTAYGRALALDTSASVAGPTLAHLQKAGGAVLDKLTAGDQAALITFSHAVVLRSPLTPSFDRLRLAIRNVMPRGDTALVDAVFAGLVFAEADVGRKLLLVFTDGYDTSSYVRRQDVADAARSTDVVVYAVTAGVQGHRTAEFLPDVANLTGGGLVSVDSTSDVERAFLAILDEFRHRYLLSFTPSGVAKTGWHKLEVRVKGRRVAVKARTGYQAGF
jgi:VWFA-related protein